MKIGYNIIFDDEILKERREKLNIQIKFVIITTFFVIEIVLLSSFIQEFFIILIEDESSPIPMFDSIIFSLQLILLFLTVLTGFLFIIYIIIHLLKIPSQ